MRVLAIDSSGLVATVAVVERDELNEKTVAEYTINHKKTHSQTLLPMLDEIVKMIELDLGSVDAIAISKGPGSFTGLRIGAATAKGLGLALEKPLIGVPTVDMIAYNMVYCDRIVCPIMDARRSQVYTGIYRFDGDKMEVIERQMAVGIDELAAKLKELGGKVVFLGDGVPVHRDYLAAELGMANVSFAPANANCQRAASLGHLALDYLEAGDVVTAEQFAPDYLRVSQAERERAEREKNG